MKKILISVPHNLLYGGVQNYVLNILKNMDLSDLKIDIYFSQFNKSSDMFEEFKLKNLKIYFGENNNNNKSQNIKNLKKLMMKNHYDVIHINTGDLSYQVMNLILAKKYNIQKRISHSHNSVVPHYKNLILLRKIKDSIYRLLIRFFSTDYFACSILAGNWMFGKKAFNKKGIVQYNGIELNKFKFNQNIRDQIRNELKIKDDTVVLGLIAYFNEQKNHSFLIDIFEQYHKKNTNSLLMLIGNGELKNEIINKVKQLNLTNYVLFIDPSKNGHTYYNAMDYFLMTSLYEGLPFVGLEAQISELPCILSDRITQEVKISETVSFLSISNTPEYWADYIDNTHKNHKTNRNSNFEKLSELLTEKGYNIVDSSKIIRENYLG